MIKVSVVGAKGRMGSHVVDAVNGAQDKIGRAHV